MGLTSTVAKTSAGAINYTPVAKVTNIVRTIEELKEKGAQLIITVDNGIAAIEAVEKAKELGIDIIVTDHH